MKYFKHTGDKNNNMNSPSPPNLVKYLLFALFVSDPLFRGENTDLAKGFCLCCHYPSSSPEVTTILNLELLLL